mgnify:CR=1 FL=1
MRRNQNHLCARCAEDYEAWLDWGKPVPNDSGVTR